MSDRHSNIACFPKSGNSFSCHFVCIRDRTKGRLFGRSVASQLTRSTSVTRATSNAHIDSNKSNTLYNYDMIFITI